MMMTTRWSLSLVVLAKMPLLSSTVRPFGSVSVPEVTRMATTRANEAMKSVVTQSVTMVEKFITDCAPYVGDVGNIRVATWLHVMARMMPARTIYIGLVAYEHDILPEIASGLAYSPTSCAGAPPSVQALVQMATPVMTSMLRKGVVCAHSHIIPTRERLEAIPAELQIYMRSSYILSILGVFFVNACPFLVPNVAVKTLITSKFAELMAGLISLSHGAIEGGSKVKIVTMGSEAADFVSLMKRAFKDISGQIATESMVHPVALARMATGPDIGVAPFQDDVTESEKNIISMLGGDFTKRIVKKHVWKIIPHSILSRYESRSALMPLCISAASTDPRQLFENFTSRLRQILKPNLDRVALWLENAVEDVDGSSRQALD